ncbi:MAG: hypothetical protein JAY74_16415 [Candidatus Thiodiazotropha taylori]|nr:hypothetical protein [Candidatus Thiodiazotropha taylori]
MLFNVNSRINGKRKIHGTKRDVPICHAAEIKRDVPTCRAAEINVEIHHVTGIEIWIEEGLNTRTMIDLVIQGGHMFLAGTDKMTGTLIQRNVHVRRLKI